MSDTQFVFDAIGTAWKITFDTSLSSPKQSKLLSEITTYIEEFDKTYSRFRDDSLIAKISQKKGTYVFPQNAKPLFFLYQKLYAVTNGAFTPLIGGLLSDAGYDAQYSLKSKTLHDVLRWEDVLEYNFPNLTVKKPVLLDFGAAGKGYLVDLVGEILKKHGVNAFSINAGGDILYKNNRKPIRVGLEHPTNPKEVIGVAHLNDGSICGSAGNRRAWGKFHHIMHPYSKTSIKNILAVWVVTENALIADGLATALFFSKADTFIHDFDFSYALVYDDFSLEKSTHFPAEFYFSEYNNTVI